MNTPRISKGKEEGEREGERGRGGGKGQEEEDKTIIWKGKKIFENKNKQKIKRQQSILTEF